MLVRRQRWWFAAVVLAVATAAGSVGSLPSSRAAGPAAAEGDVVAFGDAPAVPGRAPEGAVTLASTPLGLGWWAVSADGRVTGAGDARHLGDMAGEALNRPIVGMARTPTGGGYWLVASDGGIFSFGDARFLGSTGGMRLNRPVVGMAATPSGGGYWLVASDGGIFTFGNAPFLGAGGSATVAMAPTRTGRGYWLTGPGGQVAAFGDAASAGSLGEVEGTVVGVTGTSTGRGYWLAVGRVTDVASVWEPGGLSPAAQRWALDAARRAGAKATVYHRGTLAMLAVRRGGQVVQAAPEGWRIPMSSLAVDPDPAEPLIGRRAADALRRGEVAMGATTARLRGAAAGDEVELIGWDGRVHTRRVGVVVADARTGSAELVFSAADAAAIGFRRPSSVQLWKAERQRMGDALAGPQPTELGVGFSWEPPSPDSVLSSVRVKELLGEVVYRPGSGDGVALHPGWTGPNIVTEHVPALGRVTCHRDVFPALRGALDEVVRAGLAGGLGRYGGCYNPRLIRGGDSGGSLSRHSFGMAIDVNITRNVYGGRVELDPRIVAIFRRWGFAWGGTWVRADGMHFEWVGGRSL